MEDLKALYVFIVALVVTFLYTVREVVEQELHKTRTSKENFLIISTRVIMTAIVVVLLYGALEQLSLNVKIFNLEIEIKDKVAVFIAVVTSLFTDSLIIRGKKQLDLGDKK